MEMGCYDLRIFNFAAFRASCLHLSTSSSSPLTLPFCNDNQKEDAIHIIVAEMRPKESNRRVRRLTRTIVRVRGNEGLKWCCGINCCGNEERKKYCAERSDNGDNGDRTESDGARSRLIGRNASIIRLILMNVPHLRYLQASPRVSPNHFITIV